jgi:hypothetical protein
MTLKKKVTDTATTTSTAAIAATTIATTTTTADIDNSMMIKTKERIRVENATEGLPSNCFNHLYNRVLPGPRGKENAISICDYMSYYKIRD